MRARARRLREAALPGRAWAGGAPRGRAPLAHLPLRLRAKERPHRDGRHVVEAAVCADERRLALVVAVRPSLGQEDDLLAALRVDQVRVARVGVERVEQPAPRGRVGRRARPRGDLGRRDAARAQRGPLLKEHLQRPQHRHVRVAARRARQRPVRDVCGDVVEAGGHEHLRVRRGRRADVRAVGQRRRGRRVARARAPQAVEAQLRLRAVDVRGHAAVHVVERVGRG